MFNHILAPLDGSELAESALPHVAAMARAFGSRVTLLHVLNRQDLAANGCPVDPLTWRMRQVEARAYLADQAERLAAVDVEPETEVLEGGAAAQIIDVIGAQDVDLVVLSNHGQSGLSRWNVSSVVHKVMRGAPISTFIARAQRQAPGALDNFGYERILVPLDGSQRAECVLAAVNALARPQAERQVLLAHIVYEPVLLHRAPVMTPSDRKLVERFVQRNRDAARHYLADTRSGLEVPVETRLRVGADVPAELHTLAEEEDMDLVVLSAHGDTGNAERPYGGLTTSFIEYGTTPLLIIQDLDRESLQIAHVAEEESHWERTRPLTYAQ